MNSPSPWRHHLYASYHPLGRTIVLMKIEASFFCWNNNLACDCLPTFHVYSFMICPYSQSITTYALILSNTQFWTDNCEDNSCFPDICASACMVLQWMFTMHTVFEFKQHTRSRWIVCNHHSLNTCILYSHMKNGHISILLLIESVRF